MVLASSKAGKELTLFSCVQMHAAAVHRSVGDNILNMAQPPPKTIERFENSVTITQFGRIVTQIGRVVTQN